MLHITNGDTAIPLIAGVAQGEILPWRDVLHEGPVRAAWSAEERTRFIAEAFHTDAGKVAESFRQRDSALSRVD